MSIFGSTAIESVLGKQLSNILANFTKASADLRKLAEQCNAEVEQTDVQIATLNMRRIEIADTSDYALKVAGNIEAMLEK